MMQPDNDFSDDDDFQSIHSNSSDADSFMSLPSLSENLTSQFSDGKFNFNVVHINAQSIPAHFPDMLASFDTKNLHAILVSESFLKPCLPSTSYSLPGFVLIRNDRTGSRCGGVAIYIRSHIPFSIVSMSAQPPPSNAGEHLIIEVLLSHAKILLGVYYSPSLHVNFFSSFEKLLEDIRPSYDHTILMGDFNTCLIKQDSRSSNFESIIKSCNMHILPLGATHHSPNCTPSLLDLILVSSLQHVAKHGQCSADAFSYHDLVYLSYKIRPPKLKPKILLQRNFSAMDIESLRNDVKKIDWFPIINSDDINVKIDIFNTIITELYNIHAPIRPIKMKHLPAPWLTDDIKLLMRKKSASKTKYKLLSSDTNKKNYFVARNRCNRVCRDALRRHIHASVSDSDQAKVWKFLRTLGVGKTRHESAPKDLNIDSLNQHFSSSANISLTDKNSTLNYLSSLPTPVYSPFVFSQFTACDVKKSILTITSNAMGGDNIGRNMIIPIIDEVLPIICHLLNYSAFSCSVPSVWKEAHIIPLPKKSKPTSFTDYRPISILPFLSKVLERLVYNQLSSFLITNDLLNPFQSGFRPGHSTVTALVKITDDIRSGMESGLLTVLTLLDFSNAFNTVDFEILLGLLRSINVSPSVVDWFRSYLHGRRQRVRFDEIFSSWCSVTAGVPQGGVLSPLLFALFINSISRKLTSPYHLYADDLQIYTQATIEDLPNAIIETNNNLIKISNWSQSYGLTVNPTKTQVIILGSSRTLIKINWATLPQVQLDNITVPYSNSVKNLGVFMDNSMSWATQLESVSRKLFASAGSLRRLRNFLPTATKIALAQSLLLPILDYADSCYLDLTEVQLDKLERLQNVCIRFIFGLRKYDHVSEYRARLKWLPIRIRRNTHILSLLYNILHNPSSPSYLKDRFEYLYCSNPRTLRSSDNLLLKTPVHRTKFYADSFTLQAIRLWNALPTSVKQSPSLAVFKTRIKHLYLADKSS